MRRNSDISVCPRKRSPRNMTGCDIEYARIGSLKNNHGDMDARNLEPANQFSRVERGDSWIRPCGPPFCVCARTGNPLPERSARGNLKTDLVQHQVPPIYKNERVRKNFRPRFLLSQDWEDGRGGQLPDHWCHGFA